MGLGTTGRFGRTYWHRGVGSSAVATTHYTQAQNCQRKSALGAGIGQGRPGKSSESCARRNCCKIAISLIEHAFRRTDGASWCNRLIAPLLKFVSEASRERASARIRNKESRSPLQTSESFIVVDFRARRNLSLPPVFSKGKTVEGTLLEGGQWRSTSTIAPNCRSRSARRGKTKSRLTYAYMSLGDYRFIAADVERGRPAVGKPVFIPGDGADARIGRAL